MALGMGPGARFDKPWAPEYQAPSFRECGRAFGVRARLGHPARDYRDNSPDGHSKKGHRICDGSCA